MRERTFSPSSLSIGFIRSFSRLYQQILSVFIRQALPVLSAGFIYKIYQSQKEKHLIINIMNEIIVILWMLFGIYVAVLLLIGADLWSGVRKARRRHEVRTSKGYRQTVQKIARYYNMLMALTVMDAMQMGGVWYLDTFYGHAIPLLPVVSLLGAIGIGCIEIKSIYEKADQKERADYHDAIELMAHIAAGSSRLSDSLRKEVAE